MKITPRSSLPVLFFTLLVILAGTGYLLTVGLERKTAVVGRLTALNVEKHQAEDDAKTLQREVTSAEEKFKDARVFMDRVHLYQETTAQMAQGTGMRTRQLVEQLAQANHVTPRDWVSLQDTTRTIGEVTYIGRSYKLVVLGEFKNIGHLVADLENTVPLLRITNVQLVKDQDVNVTSQSTSISGSVSFMIVANVSGVGPNDTDVAPPDLSSVKPVKRQ
jgi:hypothetical protein